MIEPVMSFWFHAGGTLLQHADIVLLGPEIYQI